MSEGRKISTKKVVRFAIGTLLVIGFLVALVMASHQQNNKTVAGMQVRLNEDKAFSFLQTKDIEKLLLENRHIDLVHTAISNLNLRLMEEVARTNPWVANAELFVDNKQILHVNITQREPIARIFDVNGASYYMDSLLYTMPVAAGYAYAAPVFTNVPVLRNDSIKRQLSEKIAYLSEVISADTFWHAQITQIEVQPDQTFVLNTLFGDQRVLLGDTTDVHNKLINLFAFYQKISSRVGWDKYQTLDVRFKDQVVASPSIGWVPPKIVDTIASDYEGPAAGATPTQAVPTVTAAKVNETKAKENTVAAVKKETPKALPAKVSKGKTNPVTAHNNVLQARSSVKGSKPGAVKEKDKSKEKDKEKSPKYIYPGKHNGNH